MRGALTASKDLMRLYLVSGANDALKKPFDLFYELRRKVTFFTL